LTSPLPIIEPTFLFALAAGLLFSLPVGGWLQQQVEKLTANRLAVKLPSQVLYDLWLAFILLASITSTANAAFQPGIYGTF
jgi:hypothetical protein